MRRKFLRFAIKLPFFALTSKSECKKHSWNVSLPYSVDKEFFQTIIKPKTFIYEDHVYSYLAVVASKPTFAGLEEVKHTIAITGSHIMVRCFTHTLYEIIYVYWYLNNIYLLARLTWRTCLTIYVGGVIQLNHISLISSTRALKSALIHMT